MWFVLPSELSLCGSSYPVSCPYVVRLTQLVVIMWFVLPSELSLCGSSYVVSCPYVVRLT